MGNTSNYAGLNMLATGGGNTYATCPTVMVVRKRLGMHPHTWRAPASPDAFTLNHRYFRAVIHCQDYIAVKICVPAPPNETANKTSANIPPTYSK